MRVGVVGATGQVGGVMRALLAERDFPVDELRFFASARSAGRTLPWDGGEIVVEDAATADFAGLDLALFSAGEPRRRRSSRRSVAAAGAIVIDNSSAWRMDPDVPLVVAEVNAARRSTTHPEGHRRQPELHDDGRHAGAQAAARRGRAAPHGRVSTYQAVSGAGLAGVAELDEQVRKVVDRRAGADLRRRRGRVPDADEVRRARSPSTCIPFAGSLVDDGRDETDEEQKLRNESRKILEIPDLPVSVHVRAGAGVHRPLAVDQRRVRTCDHARRTREEILAAAPGVELVDIPTPLQAAGIDPCYVGRIRRDETVEHGLALFVSNDNLRKGAALNAVQIAERSAAAQPAARTTGSVAASRRTRRGSPPHFGQPSA